MADLNQIVADKMTETGVTPLTAGNLVSAHVRESLRSVLKAHDPDGYAMYKAIKYPGGPENESSATAETRLAATRFLFDRTRDLLLPYYMPINAPHA